MRALRRRTRGVRLAGAAGVVVLGVGGAVACEPGGGLGAASVAYTTDRAATHEIEQHHVKVQWLTCTARYGDGGDATASAGERGIASVDCEGRTGDGKDITVKGRVTRAVDGACVRGDLTAEVGDRQLFKVSGLGDCGSRSPSPVEPPGTGRPNDPGRPTVTVTTTVWCPGDPRCPVQGK
ncbi:MULTISPECIES: hypothetical protein [unclassified Streptomyces]|uniref:hypothetical protein n=1 Tax=unclassified Streptomyces TaxID=2593676 RepID=UPI003D760BFF